CSQVLEECLERLETAGDSHNQCLASRPAPVTPNGHRPKSPAPTRRVRQLEAARMDANEVELVYGSKGAPATLPVVPRFMFERGGHGYLEAECQRSGLLKTYRIDRIQRVQERVV
ncbi:MAG: WYL domain-containing protein, partial [bacterium]